MVKVVCSGYHHCPSFLGFGSLRSALDMGSDEDEHAQDRRVRVIVVFRCFILLLAGNGVRDDGYITPELC
jgi:hypothetical protein